jgi:hypothetical protein
MKRVERCFALTLQIAVLFVEAAGCSNYSSLTPGWGGSGGSDDASTGSGGADGSSTGIGGSGGATTGSGGSGAATTGTGGSSGTTSGSGGASGTTTGSGGAAGSSTGSGGSSGMTTGSGGSSGTTTGSGGSSGTTTGSGGSSGTTTGSGGAAGSSAGSGGVAGSSAGSSGSAGSSTGSGGSAGTSADSGGGGAGGVADAGVGKDSGDGGGPYSPLCSDVPLTGAGEVPTKGGVCTPTDTQLCYKTCGPLSIGFKSETCTGGSYVEQSSCSFPDGDYSCYRIPPVISATCPTTTPQATQPCTVAECVLCNVAGNYLDSMGDEKQGYCVCAAAGDSGTRKWSCASTTSWPCPGGNGC